MADSYLAEPDRVRTGNDRYTTLVLTDKTAPTGPDPHGSCTLDDGTHIEVATARRLACDSARQPMIRRADGSLLDADRIEPDTLTGHYAGDPLYLNDAVDGLVHNERIRTAAHPAETA